MRAQTPAVRMLAALVTALLAAGPPAAAGSVLFVDDDAAPGGDGSGWPSAYRFLQDALAHAAGSGGAITEIRVAQGTYRPDRDAAHPGGTGNRGASFALIEGVTLSGGYAGPGAGDPDARHPESFVSVLSGDLVGDDSPGCPDLGPSFENSFHVLAATGVDETAVLDGFLITKGNANGFLTGDSRGGGLSLNGGGATVADCVFAGNRALNGGGAIHLVECNATITGCRFSCNTSNPGGAGSGQGGAVFCLSSNPTITDCLFVANGAFPGVAAPARGGAIACNVPSAPTIAGCILSFNFVSSETAGTGGAIDGGNPTIEDTAFVGNFAPRGGAVALDTGTVTGCLFSENFATLAGGAMDLGDVSVTNCRFRSNEALVPEPPESSGPSSPSAPVEAGAITPGRGGAIVNRGAALISGCLFVGNRALGDLKSGGPGRGGGIYDDAEAGAWVSACSFSGNVASGAGGAIASALGGGAQVAGCVFWDDEPDEIADDAGTTTTVRFSNVEGGWSGPGAANLDVLPHFARSTDPGADGAWGTSDDDFGDLRLLPGSPCIDAGDNAALPGGFATDLDGNPRLVDDPCTADTGDPGTDGGDPIVDPVVDIGAYEFQSGVACCPGDVDVDDAVGPADLAILISAWGACDPAPPCPADLDGDGSVGFSDLLALLRSWGGCP